MQELFRNARRGHGRLHSVRLFIILTHFTLFSYLIFMLLVREVFTAKPGNASKLAKLMMEAIPPMANGMKMTVMTDLVGEFNQVVIQHEVESLADFDKMMQEYATSMPEEVKKKMAGYTEMYQTGRREIYRIQS